MTAHQTVMDWDRDLDESRASLKRYQQWKAEQRAAGITDKRDLDCYAYAAYRRANDTTAASCGPDLETERK